jgi:hypothetical protein
VRELEQSRFNAEGAEVNGLDHPYDSWEIKGFDENSEKCVVWRVVPVTLDQLRQVFGQQGDDVDFVSPWGATEEQLANLERVTGHSFADLAGLDVQFSGVRDCHAWLGWKKPES